MLHANKGIEKKPLKGQGFTIAPDGVTYLSRLNGKFEYLNGRIIISNMIVVREDVTAVTGKLEVDGSVHVIGSVYSGGYISATGDIIIEHNVQAGRLIAGGNIMIKKGSCSKNETLVLLAVFSQSLYSREALRRRHSVHLPLFVPDDRPRSSLLRQPSRKPQY